ncbi:MAG: hypothetical protein M3520_09360 [Actinomycetota bacterium]|nr:hypothetical protein [Actinomycetota bacterium]
MTHPQLISYYRLTPLGLAPVRELLAELSPRALSAAEPAAPHTPMSSADDQHQEETG